MLVINYKNNKGEFLKLRISPLLFEMKKRNYYYVKSNLII